MTYTRMAWNRIVVGVFATWIAACEYKSPIGSDDGGSDSSVTDVATSDVQPIDAAVDANRPDVPPAVDGFLPDSPPAADVVRPIECGGFAGSSCGAGEFCDYVPEAMCGIADHPGTCRARPEGCPTVFDPVCGCDSTTYPSACEANRAGVAVASHGRCATDRACGGFAGLTCQTGEFCQYDRGAMCGAADQTGTCRTPPTVCDTVLDEVCGCDGRTYSNECEAHRAGTSVSRPGACGTTDCRTTGCGTDQQCEACLAPSGVVYACIPRGSAC